MSNKRKRKTKAEREIDALADALLADYVPPASEEASDGGFIVRPSLGGHVVGKLASPLAARVTVIKRSEDKAP